MALWYPCRVSCRNFILGRGEAHRSRTWPYGHGEGRVDFIIMGGGGGGGGVELFGGGGGSFPCALPLDETLPWQTMAYYYVHYLLLKV